MIQQITIQTIDDDTEIEEEEKYDMKHDMDIQIEISLQLQEPNYNIITSFGVLSIGNSLKSNLNVYRPSFFNGIYMDHTVIFKMV